MKRSTACVLRTEMAETEVALAAAGASEVVSEAVGSSLQPRRTAMMKVQGETSRFLKHLSPQEKKKHMRLSLYSPCHTNFMCLNLILVAVASEEVEDSAVGGQMITNIPGKIPFPSAQKLPSVETNQLPFLVYKLHRRTRHPSFYLLNWCKISSK